MTKVDITVAGHTIIVEADADLDAVAAKALELYWATHDANRPAIGFGSHLAGAFERAGGPAYVARPDVDLAGGPAPGA